MQSAATPPRIIAWFERRPSLAYALVLAFALLLTLPTLGELGLLSDAEIPAWNRARAANGAQLDGLLRQPVLPEWMRARAVALAGDEVGLRLPSALAHAACGLLVLALARALHFTWPAALLAPLFVWAFPVNALSGRAAESPLITEAFVALALLAGLEAGKAASRPRLALWLGVLGLACVAASASAGVVWGAALPLATLAIAGYTLDRRLRLGLGVAAIALGLLALRLALGQERGYIPLLGAAPDLYLFDKPERRDLVAAIEEFGHQIFPFTILPVLGMAMPATRSSDASTQPRIALPATWLGLGLALAVVWTGRYGRMDLPLTLPAALCSARALALLFDAGVPHRMRRFALVIAICGLWVMGKDGARTPSRIASPQHHFTHEKRFPDQAIGAHEHFEDWVRWGWLALLLAYAVSPRSREAPRPGRLGRLEQMLPTLSAQARESLPWVVFSLALAYQSVDGSRRLASANAEHLSLREVFARHQQWVEAGYLPPTLGMQRVRDDGLARYGPADAQLELLPTRKELFDWLTADDQRVAIIRGNDFPGIFQKARERGWSLHVLDWEHHDLKLVANFVPAELEEVFPLADVVYDEDPKLEHETLVRFEDRVELVGWEIDGEVRRGGEVTVSLAFRVLRAMPGSSQIYVRLQQGRMSKINVYPHDPAEGRFPGNYWRKGDYIVDRYTFEIPAINTIPGEHTLFVGIAKNDKAKLRITVPEGRKGDFGVEIRGTTHREYANLATIELR